MPIRAFVSQNIQQLQATLGLLEMALQSGSIEELRVAGIMTRTGPLKPGEVQLRYNQCRYELFLRVQSLADDSAGDEKNCILKQQFTNPYCEKIMHVDTQRSSPLWPEGQTAQIIP